VSGSSGRPLRRHTGRCHCGAVRFAVTSDFPELTTCDCSLCRRRSALMVKVHESAFELLAGAEQLATYQWHSHTAVHHFCKLCWVKHENHTPTGAFKVRGGLVYIDRLKRERPGVPGVVSPRAATTASRSALPGAPRRAGHHRRAARQQPREERGDARLRRRAVEHGEDFQAARGHAQGWLPSAGLDDGAVLPCRPGRWRRELCAGAVRAAPAWTRSTCRSAWARACGLVAARDALGLATRIRVVSIVGRAITHPTTTQLARRPSTPDPALSMLQRGLHGPP
jgi:hypothetical protein